MTPSPRRSALTALALVALLAARGADAADPPCADCSYRGELNLLFVDARALGPSWETLEEMPEDPSADPELIRAGVRAIRALHYTRAVPGGSRVCSAEIWAYASGAQARRAAHGNERPGWRITVVGNLWVTLRGVRMQRGEPLRPGLMPECHRLADLIEARAASLLEPAGK